MTFRRRKAVRREGDVFGTIHPTQAAVRFSFRGHWRIMTALLLLSGGGGYLMTKTVDSSVGQVPVPTPPVVLARTKRQAVAAPKQARVWMPVLASEPKINLIERMNDGSVAQSSYFDVSLDLAEPAPAPTPKPELLLAAYQEPVATKPDPFDSILQPGHRPEKPMRPGQGPKTELVPAGVPINVSVAPVRPAGKVRRVVAMPAQEELLRNIEGALDVPSQEFADLALELGSDSVKPGERLDLIIGERIPGSGRTEIILARLKTGPKQERLLARRDDGRFQQVANRHLYDRLVAEALAAEGAHPAEAQSPDERQARALEAAEADYPRLLEQLRGSKVPTRVCLQTVELLKANDIRWKDGEELPKVNLVFRKGDDGAEELVSVSLRQGEEERRFYRYKSGADGRVEFFDDKGRSVSKTLMHKPVAAGKEGDGFGWRVHPILGTRKFHNGVDYVAPKGSPIVAAGDGVVDKISWEGGYGKFVRIRHDGGYTTTYAHIDGTPKGLAVGQRVSQGQTIAFVGSTGLSTGPHLYYELRIGDNYADPTKARMAAGTTLKGRALDEFHKEIDRVEQISRAIRSSATAAARAAANVFSPETPQVSEQ
ncbi:M23 family metallopeptidase [Rhizobium oryzicola]|uniref:M23 family metallopeptidase n=1 Tax=Rhizobium oryzicola TaxID=1232668 RepID=A0ABT8SV01_9HYPH|nr:M23 family metallopeptidase [Rhizobium oryzicola]MDO1582269.1 M23 family metallopeptidase [Rhizobium oryzicola]